MIPFTTYVWILSVAWVLLLGIRIIYRLFFHPLRNFPGPKLAAASSCYQTYHDVIRHGQYIWVIKQMHEKYGPIVRITPNELHINDPYFYDEIYAGGNRKRDKTIEFSNAGSFNGALLTTIFHDQHRFRRGIINKLFSTQAVRNFDASIQEHVDTLVHVLEEAKRTDSVVKLTELFGALSADVVSQFTYGTSHGYLKGDSNEMDLLEAVYSATVFAHTTFAFPFLASMALKLPFAVLRKLPINTVPILELREWAGLKIAEVAQQQKIKTDKSQGPTTLFEMLVDDNVPAAERDPLRLKNEAATIFAAGVETCARVMALSVFHLTKDRSKLEKLREELHPVMSNRSERISPTEMEKLPYLTGVINEGLRLSYGSTLRFPRVAPDEALHFEGFVIPPGTVMSQSNYFLHTDPSIFPDPTNFDPERWIRAAENDQNLKRFIGSFSKGSRQCLGMTLAYSLLYIAMPAVFSRFDMELYNTTEEDVVIGRDLAFSQPVMGRFRVDVKVAKVLGDYCDVYLTHDSMSVRKAHNSGRNHLRNVVDYYQQIGQEKAQSVIDSITSSYAAEGQPLPNPAMVPGAFPPPFGFPGGPGQAPPFGIPPPGAPGAPPRMFPPRGNPNPNPQGPPKQPKYPLNAAAANQVPSPWTAPGGRGMPFPPPFPNASGTPPTGGFPPPNFNLPPGANFPPPPAGFPANFPIPPPGSLPPMPMGGATHSPIPSGPRGSEGYPPPPGGGPPPGMDQKW